jgi:type I restriction enzyme S subunit
MMPTPLPPLPEQQRIAVEVDRQLSESDELERTIHVEIERASRLCQAILRRAFEGKLVPQDPRDEPAGVLLERIRAARGQVEVKQEKRRERRGKGPRQMRLL